MSISITNNGAVTLAQGQTVSLSSLFTITGGGNPQYLVLSGCDREEYTASQILSLGTLSGNKKTAKFFLDDGDFDSVSIDFMWTASGYYNSKYGYFNSITFTGSSTIGECEYLSLYGASSASVLADYNTRWGYSSAYLSGDTSDFICNASLTTIKASTVAAILPASHISGQALPSDIGAVAASFVGKAWNDSGCWVLASEIATIAGAALPIASTATSSDSVSNGEWITVYTGVNGVDTNWLSTLRAGDVVGVEWSDGSGHIAAIASGAGSGAMVIDNSGNSARDGSPYDIIIQAAHSASDEFGSDVVQESVEIYRLDVPYSVSSATASSGSSPTINVSGLVSFVDPAGKAITQYQLYDTANTGFVANGGPVSASAAGQAVTVTSLSGVLLNGRTTTGTDTLEIRAYNGSYWGDWQAVTITESGTGSSSLFFSLSLSQVKALSLSVLSAVTVSDIAGLSSDQLKQLSTTQIEVLSAEAIAALTTTQLKGVTATTFGSLSATQVAALGTTDLRVLTTAEVKALSAAQAALLRSDQIAALAATQLNAMTAATIASLSESQLGGLASVQLMLLSTSFLKALTVTEIGELSVPQLDVLNAAQIQVLTSTQLAGLSTTQFGGLTTTEVAFLAAAQLQVLATSQLAALTSGQIAALTSNQLKGMGTFVLDALTTTQVAALSTTALKGLTVTEVGALGTGDIAALGTVRFDSLSSAQLKAITATQVPSLSTDQLLGLSGSQLVALTTAAFAGLNAGQVGALTVTQIRALGAPLLKSLNLDTVAGLPAATLDLLSASQLGTLTTAQIKVIGGAVFSTMSTSEISGLTSTQLKVMTTDQLAALTRTFVGALSKAQSKAFTSDQLANLLPAQVMGNPYLMVIRS